MKLALIIIDLLVIVSLMAIIILQSGKSSGLSGALAGGSDTYLAKNKSKTFDARLARATKWVAGVFVVLTVVLNMI